MLAVSMAFLLIVVVSGALFGLAGVFLSYYFGRRAAERKYQSGFPVLPADRPMDRRDR
jgi:hypothetical protein